MQDSDHRLTYDRDPAGSQIRFLTPTLPASPRYISDSGPKVHEQLFPLQ